MNRFVLGWLFVCMTRCLDFSPDNLFDPDNSFTGLTLLSLLGTSISTGPVLGVSFADVRADPLPARAGEAASVVFQNRMYVIGGASSPNAVWSSGDGIVWLTEAEGVFSGQGRYRSSALAFNGRMYLLGGSEAVDDFTTGVSAGESVWSSVDGRNWINAAPACVDCPSIGAAFVLQGRMWFVAPGGVVYSSVDGTNWSVTNTSISVRPDFALVFNGQAYVFDSDGSVWTTGDGTAWTRHAFQIGPVARWGSYRSGAVFDQRMWLFQDTAPSPGRVAGALYSYDGNRWEIVNVGCCRRVQRHANTVEVFQNHIWLLGGVINFPFASTAGVQRSLGGGTGVDGAGRTDFSL